MEQDYYIVQTPGGGILRIPVQTITTTGVLVGPQGAAGSAGAAGATGAPGASGTVAPRKDAFTVPSDGSTTYALSFTPLSSASVAVYLNGLQQPPSEYTVSGNQVSFTSGTGITANDVLIVNYST